jgi:hypothetical protein
MSPLVEIRDVFCVCENYLWSVFQRTQTLLKEYKERDKSNVFTDKRFGEYNSNISPEEKMMKRFALEQQVWKKNLEESLYYKFSTEVKQQVSPCYSVTLFCEYLPVKYGGRSPVLYLVWLGQRNVKF